MDGSEPESAKQPKFMRYRSVRRAHEAAVAAAPPPLPPNDDEAAESAKRKESVKRSMSRYRNRPAHAPMPAPMPAMPPVPTRAPAPGAVYPENPFADPRPEEMGRPREMKQEVKKDKGGFLSRFMGEKPNGKGSDHNGFESASMSRKKSSPYSPVLEAPITAANPDKRYVRVACNDAFCLVAFDQATKTRDIMDSAADTMSVGVDPENSTVAEFFTPLNIERPLRKYEHVRDIVNSWDNDSQNHLSITLRDDDEDHEADEFLEARFAPHKQPAGATFHLYHAGRNRKWKKSFITLRSDGQVTLSKKKEPKPKQIFNICHMSDFDIYTLTSREEKRIKVPRKNTFAVKSMQKSNMFYKNDNFVHYFSTKDAQLAEKFYVAYQGWRSYYLVHIRGAGIRNGHNSSYKNGVGNGNSNNLNMNVNMNEQHQIRSSTESSRAYQPGTFKPLLDFNDRDAPDPIVERITTRGSASAQLSRSNTYKKSSSLHRGPSQSHSLSRPTSPTKHYGSPPLSRPLSREAAISRPKSRSRRPTAPSAHANPITAPEEPFAPTSLLGRTYTQRQAALKERERHDVEPAFSPSGLVANISRRQSTRHRSNTVRRPTNSGRSSIEQTGASYDRENPFNPGGLLAGLSRQNSRVAGTTGRGVVTGNRNAARPLLDLSEPSQFAEGSLLRDVELRQKGGYGGY